MVKQRSGTPSTGIGYLRRQDCIRDVRFTDARGAKYTAAEVVQSATLPQQMQFCFITFRSQKNGQNGEERKFARHTEGGTKCFVTAMLSILHRFMRLRGVHDLLTPIGLYQDAGMSAPRLITSVDIESEMRAAACSVYSLDPVRDKVDLQRWSSHSLRVGACVILHALGFQPVDIKFILRWRSDAYLVYLRNTAILAIRHVQAMDEAFTMPYLV